MRRVARVDEMSPSISFGARATARNPASVGAIAIDPIIMISISRSTICTSSRFNIYTHVCVSQCAHTHTHRTHTPQTNSRIA